MGYSVWMVSLMSIAAGLITLRKEHGLTQQEMADKIGLHVNQVRRYESGSAQPSLEAFKKIAIAMSITTDSLVFGPEERGLDEQLRLQFEAISHIPPQEKKIIQALLEGMIVKHQSKQMVGSLSS